MIDLKQVGEIAYEWGIRCFGPIHMETASVRALRTAEEVIELAQVCQVDKDKLHLLIDTVYSRPEGILRQEFGGCMITLLVLAEGLSISVEACTYTELRRILNKSPEHFKARNEEKEKLGLD